MMADQRFCDQCGSGVGTQTPTPGASAPNPTVLSSGTAAEYQNRQAVALKRPVFDKTGIAGAFDFTLHYVREQDASSGPSLFTAIKETMGLKLESAKGPVEILIVDQIEKAPTEN